MHSSQSCEACQALWRKHRDDAHDQAACDICYRQESLQGSLVHNPAFCPSCQHEFSEYLAFKQQGYGAGSARADQWQSHLSSPHDPARCLPCYEIWMGHRYQTEDFAGCQFCLALWQFHQAGSHEHFRCKFCMEALQQHWQLHGSEDCPHCALYSSEFIEQQLNELVIEEYEQEGEAGQRLVGQRHCRGLHEVSQQLEEAIAEYYRNELGRAPSARETRGCLEDVAGRIRSQQEIDLEAIVLGRIRTH